MVALAEFVVGALLYRDVLTCVVCCLRGGTMTSHSGIQRVWHEACDAKCTYYCMACMGQVLCMRQSDEPQGHATVLTGVLKVCGERGNLEGKTFCQAYVPSCADAPDGYDLVVRILSTPEAILRSPSAALLLSLH